MVVVGSMLVRGRFPDRRPPKYEIREFMVCRIRLHWGQDNEFESAIMRLSWMHMAFPREYPNEMAMASLCLCSPGMRWGSRLLECAMFSGGGSRQRLGDN